jgi:hypothetical protein
VLDREKVIVALERKRDQFAGYSADLQRQQQLVQDRLAAIRNLSSQAILERLQALGVAWPGALPTPEFDAAQGLCLPFGRAWQNHEDARAWALEALRDRPTLAVDGSQITPTKDLSIPVGAVQVGWFINYHSAGKRYLKDVEFEVLGPQELMEADEAEDAGDRALPNWRVNQVRFVRECERLCALMTEAASRPIAARPLCFFDGSFIISFAGQMRPARAQPYVRAVEQLLACSTATRVPLVAFVDRSYSRDFVTLMDLLAAATPPLALSDATLLDALLPAWGDRSPLFICARDDTLSREGRAAFYQDVAVTYVRLTRDRTPARVEMPRWLVEEGQADDVLDLVRAEAVVGTGYPYAVETADALAVIGNQDRERFYNLFEQFVQRTAGLSLVQARKAASKAGRR